MAGLPDRLIAQIAFKAGGDIFHHIILKNPKHMAKVLPVKFQDCELIQGVFGTAGTVIQWKYTHDGKEQISKQILQDIDEEKKQVSFKMISGDLTELYKNMVVTFHVETKDGVDHVTWTIDYELVLAETPHPVSLLNFFIELTKEIEIHIYG